MLSARAVLAAFVGALAWFLWTVEHQTVSACSPGSHYVSSAALALAAIVGIVLLSHRPWRSEARRRSAIIELVGTAVLSATGLLVAGYFAAVLSCTGG